MILRLLNIAKGQFRSVSFGDFVETVKHSLFCNDLIFVYTLNLEEVAGVEANNRSNVEVRKGSVSDLEETVGRFNPLPWEFQCHSYDGVADFFVACDSEGIQHISWIYYCNDPNRLLSLSDREAEIKYCLTLPAFRGRGLYPGVLRTIAQFLTQEGFRRVFVCVHEANTSSIRGIEKAGFKRVGRVRLQKVAGLQVSKRLMTAGI